VKTSETAPDERKTLRRQEFLKRLRDERLLGEAEALAAKAERSQLAQRREEPARESTRALPRQKEEQVQRGGTAQARREEELQAALLLEREAERQAEIRAAGMHEEQWRAQINAAAQMRREEELRAAALQEKEAERQAEMRAAKAREARVPEEEQRRAQASAAEQQRREEEQRAAALRKQEAERQAEMRAAEAREGRVQEEERRAQASAATQIQRERESQREEERQAATLRWEQAKQRVAERERDATALQSAEKQRQEQQEEEAIRTQGEAKRAAVQMARQSRQQEETEARAPAPPVQGQPRRIGVARSRAQIAARAPSAQRMGAASAAVSQGAVPPQPGQPLYLSTSGNVLLDENGQQVSLRGVTVRGLDTVAPASGQTFPAALALDDSNLLEMSNVWGVNLVRLPFQAATILSGNGKVAAAAMLAGLDATVAAITEAGAYVLLALEAPAGGGTPPAPDASTTQAWQTLATRYQAEPRVLYEVFASGSPLAANWPQSAAALVARVRQQNPASVIFLGSGHGGADVTGLPLLSQSGDPISNLVYTIAVSAQSQPDPDDGHFRGLAESYPALVSMWSDDAANLGRTSARVADLFERYGIGWAAANWNADDRLVADAANHDFTPTGWGIIAQRALAVSAVTAFKPTTAVSQAIAIAHGPALPGLSTSGSFIVDAKGAPVNLRGVMVRGLDTIAPASGQSFPAALALDDSNLQEMSQRWGVNLVRLPFQAATILAGNSNVPAAAMLVGLDAAVAAINEAGVYVLLALEAPPSKGAPVTPDISANQVWQTLAERYKGNSGVLCEMFSCLAPISGNWYQIAATLVTTVRQRKPASLIFLGSGKGGSDVSGLPLQSGGGDPVVNCVYTIAASPGSTPNADDGKLQALAESNPVFASAWSDDGSDFGRSSSRVADLFDRYGIGWAAANWNAEPRLVADAAGHDFTATGWGLIAGRAFRMPGKLQLKPFGSDAGG
jgi:hypothetical protein